MATHAPAAGQLYDEFRALYEWLEAQDELPPGVELDPRRLEELTKVGYSPGLPPVWRGHLFEALSTLYTDGEDFRAAMKSGWRGGLAKWGKAERARFIAEERVLVGSLLDTWNSYGAADWAELRKHLHFARARVPARAQTAAATRQLRDLAAEEKPAAPVLAAVRKTLNAIGAGDAARDALVAGLPALDSAVADYHRAVRALLGVRRDGWEGVAQFIDRAGRVEAAVLAIQRAAFRVQPALLLVQRRFGGA